MQNFFVAKTSAKALPITPICQGDFTAWLKAQPARVKNLIASNRFLAEPNTFCLLTDSGGNLNKVLLGVDSRDDFFAFGILPKVLPKGSYYIDAPEYSLEQIERAALGWGMGNYHFKAYKSQKSFLARLVCQKNYNLKRLQSATRAIFFIRNLINLPASDLYPEKLAEVTANLAHEFGAELKVIKGNELARDFPAVYAVGCGSERQPLLIDLQYGDLTAPKIALVGKGVCFDSGGLQLKSSSNMLTMKKDMAGGAHVLGLACMIMKAKLPVNLRVIIPAVENLPSGGALKPGDIIKTRSGKTVEVANTDAEGRLILADALTFISEWQPKLILDFATLTGAARVALGPDINALFASHDELAENIASSLHREQETVWRLPLYQPYLESFKSEVADFKNVAMSVDAGAGAIIAALFLQQFVAKEIEWAHFDINAYNALAKPGRPAGGEACCLRGVFRYLAERFWG